MKSFIFGATTLKHFTGPIETGFRELNLPQNPDFEIYQIHASPQSIEQDLKLLELAKLSKSKKIFLLHRPDELLKVPELKVFFEENPAVSIVVLGDLVLNLEFWQERKLHISVIPHPFLSLDFPVKDSEKYVIGSFTSWGEMRKLGHLFELFKHLPADKFECRVGGTLDGRALTIKDVPAGVRLASEPFVSHFNVQLYHLNGKKRIGESSGSLHRGVSIPVIFEANGIERVEGLKVVKIEADDELKNPDYKRAAAEIVQLTSAIDEHLKFNFDLASKNLPRDFATSFLKVVLPNLES